MKTLRKFKIHIFRSVECIPRSIEKIKKFVPNFLPGSIGTRSIKKEHSIELDKRFPISLDWSKIIFNWSKHVKHEFSIIFLKQFSTVFMNKLPSYKHNRLNLRPKTEFHWCYSLKVQSNILNIKLKQHHNINISFNQTIISITMQKIDYIIF